MSLLFYSPNSDQANASSSVRCVFVIDDDDDARQSVAALVKSRGLQVCLFSSGEEFLNSYQPTQRGCIVLDVRMNGISGLDLQVELKRRQIKLPVIIITGYADVPMAVQAMHNGAITFLEKPCGDKELWHHIELALNQEENQAENVKHIQEIRKNYETLTTGERQVLELLLHGKANKTIATELDIGLRTVEMRRAVILKKMQAGSLAELVRLIMVLQEKT
jgi:two-component system, LuxR family, response regulator FixJ